MPYIPEHRFQGNLYSNLGEFVILETNVPYQGSYHKLSSGKFFSGATPYNNISQELVPLADTSPSSLLNNQPVLTLGGSGFPNKNITENYFKIFNVNKNLTYFIPQSFSPIPTSEDYANGTFIRYFLYNTVTKNYLEVDQDTYDSIKKKSPEWDYFNYQAFILPWRISGTREQITKTNTRMIEVIGKNSNLSSYLVDLCEYSKITPAKDIFTYKITYQNMKGESSIPTLYNPPTTGSINTSNDFHIMSDGTVMPGKTHEEYLKTLASSVNTQTSSSITSPTPTTTPSIPNNTNRGGY